MKTKLNRGNFLKSFLFASCYFVGMRTAISAETRIDISNHYKSLEALKKEILWVSKWWEINFRGKLFIACLQEIPSYGQSKHNVYAWRKFADGSLELVWTYRMAGIGLVEVGVEEGKGIITVTAKAYTNLKDSVIALANLDATAR